MQATSQWNNYKNVGSPEMHQRFSFTQQQFIESLLGCSYFNIFFANMVSKNVYHGKKDFSGLWDRGSQKEDIFKYVAIYA